MTHEQQRISQTTIITASKKHPAKQGASGGSSNPQAEQQAHILEEMLEVEQRFSSEKERQDWEKGETA